MTQRVSISRQLAAVNLAIQAASRASAKALRMSQSAFDLYLGDLRAAAGTLAEIEAKKREIAE